LPSMPERGGGGRFHMLTGGTALQTEEYGEVNKGAAGIFWVMRAVPGLVGQEEKREGDYQGMSGGERPGENQIFGEKRFAIRYIT